MNRMRQVLGPFWALAVLGCAATLNLFVDGGTVVGGGYKPQKVLVTYRGEGDVPKASRYHLIETLTGPAIFEEDVSDGSGTLFETRWQDAEGDHFAVAIPNRVAYEVVVPADRSLEARRWVYTHGWHEGRGALKDWMERQREKRVDGGRLIPLGTPKTP